MKIETFQEIPVADFHTVDFKSNHFSNKKNSISCPEIQKKGSLLKAPFFVIFIIY
jgi:hypothetical protein